MVDGAGDRGRGERELEVTRGTAFARPHRYGEFPAFAGHDEASAYAEVSRLVLGREGDFRKLTYASPNQGITEGALNDYRSRLAERCTPLAAKRKPAAKHKPAAKRRVGGPPRYTDCKPPGSGVDQAAWTGGADRARAGGDRRRTGPGSSPSPPATYGQIVGEVAKLQQLEADITQAQRRYVLADYGLSMTVGAEVKGRLLTLDQTAALSAGRQAFAIWVTQLYLPAYWWRYYVSGCRRGADTHLTPILTYACDVPNGSFARITGRNGPFTNFNAVLVVAVRTHPQRLSRGVAADVYVGLSGRRHLFPPGGPRAQGVPVHDPTPGSTAAWRYGCPYGVPASELIDGANGWNLPLTRCAANEGSCTNALRAKRPRRGHLRSMYRP